jgi:uncharacterized protein
MKNRGAQKMTKSQPTRVVRCPRCRKSVRYDAKNPNRPFCSADCKNRDTIAWADEAYSFPGGPQKDSDEPGGHDDES